jgi:ABC-2 type transport system permease protein
MSAPDVVVNDTAIHDVGYRRYEGPREGVRGAWRALFGQGFRAMFGLGRPLKSKAVPAFVLAATMLPCLATLAASSATEGQLPIMYGNLIESQLILFVLFAAAQAPELFSHDQQHRVLPLIFTRDATRDVYASARIVAVLCALLVVCAAPLLLLYIGEIGIAADPASAFRQMWTKAGPVLMQATLTAWVVGGVGAAMASMTARRGYATASVIGVFLVAAAIATGLDDLAGISADASGFVDPLRSLHRMALILFDEKSRAMLLSPPPPLWILAGMAVSVGLAGVLATFWRLRRVRV